jgi:hypothetical protein
MDKRQIFIFAAVAIVLAIRLYQKFKKKDTSTSGSDPKNSSDSSFPSSSKYEEYEPYSKK